MGNRATAWCGLLFALVLLGLGGSCGGGAWHRQAGKYVVVQPGPGETRASVAEAFGGGRRGIKALDTLNPPALTPGNAPLLVPVSPGGDLGIRSTGYPVVPVLSYRWDDTGIDPSPARLRTDLTHLKSSGYTLLSPDDFLSFIRMERALPDRSVLITLEVHRAEGFRALLPFVTTFGSGGLLFVDPAEVGTKGGLSWDEVRGLAAAGFETSLIPSTEKGLTAPLARESLVGYVKRVKAALAASHGRLTRQAKSPVRFAAYPDNQGNSVMASVLISLGVDGVFQLGDGGNPFFCDPLGLIRMDVGGRGAQEPLVPYLETFRTADLSW